MSFFHISLFPSNSQGTGQSLYVYKKEENGEENLQELWRPEVTSTSIWFEEKKWFEGKKSLTAVPRDRDDLGEYRVQSKGLSFLIAKAFKLKLEIFYS